jgi:hypothetical protein
MSLKKIFFVLAILLPLSLLSQDNIETDRPTESQSAELVDKKTFQLETGFRKQQENKEDYVLHHPEAVLRYGLLKRLELRLAVNATSERLYSEDEFNYGLEPIEIGLKARVFQTKDTSFITTLYTQFGVAKWAAKDHQLDESFYRLRLLFQNKLTEKIKLSYNVGRDWDSNNKEQMWIYTIAPQFELSEKWHAFVEEFGSFAKGHTPEHYVDGGFSFFVTNNIELDVNAGKGISSNAADYFFTGGISFRIK